MIFLDFTVAVTEAAHYGGLLSLTTLQNTKTMKKTMDGVADDVGNEHDSANDDMEGKTRREMVQGCSGGGWRYAK